MSWEVDEQLGETTASLVVVPVSVGSFAQSGISLQSNTGATKTLTVEPDGAACLYKSLVKGESPQIQTTVPTIMAGLECSTVSRLAWPF